MLAGELNHPEGPYRIDIALLDARVAIEYDSWYWHGDCDDTDRDEYLIAHGWQVLHVRSNATVPFKSDLLTAVKELHVSPAQVAELVLDDWGEGPTFQDYLDASAEPPSAVQLRLWT
jgi:hypothetical protein